jgi:hypothetical protein
MAGQVTGSSKRTAAKLVEGSELRPRDELESSVAVMTCVAVAWGR